MATNFSDIKKFYNLITPRFFKTNPSIPSTFFKTIKDIFLETRYSNVEIEKKIADLFQDDNLNNYVLQLIDDTKYEQKNGDFPDFINPVIFYKETTSESNVSDNVSMYIFSSRATLSPGITYAEDVDFFINAIPTIEMSKCSPYFDIYFEFL